MGKPTPFQQLQSATYVLPPDAELAREAMSGIGSEISSAEDRTELVTKVTETLGELVTRLQEAEPPVPAAIVSEFVGHLGTYQTLTDVLNQKPTTPEEPTQTKGKKQTGGKA